MTDKNAIMINPDECLSNPHHLTVGQRGALFLLVVHEFLHDLLPDSDEQLAKIVKMTPKQWVENRSAVMGAFESDWKRGCFLSEQQYEAERG